MPRRLKVTLRLVVWDIDEDTGARSIRDIKEQDVYMGDMPLMTGNGTFVVNGTERVIVSQMHRSPGVFFDHDKGKTHSSGQVLVCRAGHSLSRLLARFRIRRQGSRVVRIDRRRKLPATTLLLALDSMRDSAKPRGIGGERRGLDPAEAEGMSKEEVLAYFYDTVAYRRAQEGLAGSVRSRGYRGVTLEQI